MLVQYEGCFRRRRESIHHLPALRQAPSAGIVLPWVWVALFTFEWFAPPMLIAALLLEKVKPKYWWGVFMFAVYGLTWVPLDFIALFTRNDQTWFHTIHKQAAIPSK